MRSGWITVSWGIKLACSFLLLFTWQWFTETIGQNTGFCCILVIEGFQVRLAEVTWPNWSCKIQPQRSWREHQSGPVCKQKVAKMIEWSSIRVIFVSCFQDWEGSIESWIWEYNKLDCQTTCVDKNLGLYSVLFRFSFCQCGGEQEWPCGLLARMPLLEKTVSWKLWLHGHWDQCVLQIQLATSTYSIPAQTPQSSTLSQLGCT